MERRLAALLAADVVGYSRLMGADEAGTLAALMAHGAEFVDPEIAARGGRIVNSRYFVRFESFIATGLFHLCVTFCIVWCFKQWERVWYAHLRAQKEKPRTGLAAILAGCLAQTRG